MFCRFLSALLILMGETETQHQYSKTVWTKYLERIKSDKAFLLRDVSDVYEGKRNCSGGGNTPDSPLIPYKLDSTNRTDHSVSSSMKSESDTRSNNTIKKSMEPPKSIRRHQEDTTVDNVFGIASIQDEDILGGIDFNGFTSQRYAIVPRLPKAFSLLVGGLRKLSIDDSMSDSSGRSSTTNEDQKAIVSLLMNQPTLDLPSTVEKSLSERIKRSIQELSGSLAHSSGSNSSNSLQYLEYSKIFLDSISRQLTDNKINKGLQNEALVSFSGITRRLPPNTPVKLPIRVHWIRAVRPLRSGQMVNEVNERILVRARNVAKEAMHSFDSTFTTPTKNALYYDPFAAHRASIRSKSNCSYYYFSGESFKLRLYLENPLALPIEIDRIVPIVTGATAEIRPVGIHLAANSMHYLDIVVIPLEPGELVITGVKLFFQNAAQLLRVEADGSIINRRFVKKCFCYDSLIVLIITRTELGGYLEYPRPARERLDLNGANKVMDEDVINSNTLSIVNAFPRISHSIATLTEEESIASIRNNFKDSVTLVHNNEPFKSMRLFHSEVAPLRLLISATSSSMSKANLSVDPPVYDFRLIAREFIISECGDEQELQSYTLITFSQALRPIESERIDESELFLQRRRCCHVPLSGNSKQFLHCAKIGDLEWTPTLLDQRCYSLQIPLTLQACASVIRVELEVELVGLGDREALQRAVVVATASTESLAAFDRNTLASLTTLQIFSKKMFCHFGLNNQIMSSSPSKKEDLSVCDVRLIKKQIATNTYEVNRANEAIRRTLKRSNLLENSCPVNNEFCSAARSFVDLESCRVLSDHFLVQCQVK